MPRGRRLARTLFAMNPHLQWSEENGRRRVTPATKLRDVMTPAPHTIGSDQSLALAHRIMREHGLRHLPVLRSGKLVGILSQRDLYFLETIAGVDVDLDSVSDAMTSEVYTAAPDDLLADVARKMFIHKYGCTVVMDGDRLLGIFTATDALRYLADVLV
jgi:acetoin utilization protein AcuB